MSLQRLQVHQRPVNPQRLHHLQRLKVQASLQRLQALLQARLQAISQPVLPVLIQRLIRVEIWKPSRVNISS